MKISWDENTFGITQRSLKKLRDELAGRVRNKIAVLEIQTSDITCGFLLIDKTLNQAIWTGDGFRTDGGGEGGAGYRTAEALFRIFGVRPDRWEKVNIDLLWANPELALRKMVERVLLDGIDFVQLGKATPEYLR